jgi:hypothetical protein
MARKKSSRVDETGTEQATSEDVVRQISANKLKRLMKERRTAKENSREINSTLGGKISTAVQHDRLHKKAFSVLGQMDDMSPEKLADFWDTLQFYVEISGIGARAASAPRLELVAGTDVEHDDEEPASEAAE